MIEAARVSCSDSGWPLRLNSLASEHTGSPVQAHHLCFVRICDTCGAFNRQTLEWRL